MPLLNSYHYSTTTTTLFIILLLLPNVFHPACSSIHQPRVNHSILYTLFNHFLKFIIMISCMPNLFETCVSFLCAGTVIRGEKQARFNSTKLSQQMQRVSSMHGGSSSIFTKPWLSPFSSHQSFFLHGKMAYSIFTR